MNKAYLYSAFCSNGENAADASTVFHQKSDAKNRRNVFLLKDVNSSFEEIEATTVKHTVTITYPTQLTIKRNNKTLAYSVVNGNRVSTIPEIEHQSEIRLDVVKPTGYEFVYDEITTAILSSFGDTIIISNIEADSNITIRRKSDDDVTVHLIFNDYTKISELVVNSQICELSSNTFDVVADRNRYPNVMLSFDIEANYMIDYVKASTTNPYSISNTVLVVNNANSYFVSISAVNAQGEYTYDECYVFINTKRVPTNDYVVEISSDTNKIHFIETSVRSITNPSASELFYFSNSLSRTQISCTAKSGCYFTKRIVDGVETTLNDSTDSFFLEFDTSKYGNDNKYVIEYEIHDTADDVYYNVLVKGVDNTTATVDNVALPEVPNGTDMIATFQMLNTATMRIVFTADEGYRITQHISVSSGTATISNLLSNDGSSAWIEISNPSSDMVIQCVTQPIPKYTVNVTCLENMSISSNLGTVISSSNQVTVSNVEEGSNVELTVTYDDEFVYTVSGFLSSHRKVGNGIKLNNITSNIEVVISEKPNDECRVVVNSIVNTLTGVSIDGTAVSGTTVAAITAYEKTISNITDATRVYIVPTVNPSYEIMSYGVIDENENDLSSYLSFDGTRYILTIPKTDGEYLDLLYVSFLCQQNVADNYYVKINITPGHLLNISASDSISENISYTNPTDSVIIFIFNNNDEYALINYNVNSDNATFNDVTGENVVTTGIVGSTMVRFDTLKSGPDNPYVININTTDLIYKITINGLSNYSEAQFFNADILDFEIFAWSGNVAKAQISKSYNYFFYIIELNEGFKLSSVTTNDSNSSVVFDEQLDDDGIRYIYSINIENLSSDIVINMNIVSVVDWKTASVLSLSAPLLSYTWEVNSNGYYAYTGNISSSTAVTACIGVNYVINSDYRIIFNSSKLPNVINIKITTSKFSSAQYTTSGYTSLDSSQYTLIDKTFVISVETLKSILTPESGKTYYMYIQFKGFSASSSNKAAPIIEKIEYYQRSELGLNSVTDNTSLQTYFNSNNIIDVQIINEVDLTAQTVPFSSYSVTVIDENNLFNPLFGETQISKNQLFELYSLVCDYDISYDGFGNIIRPAYYITKCATVKLDNISSSNSSAVLQLIGPLEFYSRKYLSENEKLYSSIIVKTKTKVYLQMLFGTDVDVSVFRDDDEITTPFYEESKTEIARIIAQYYAMYLDEDNKGRICFKTIVSSKLAMLNSNSPYKLSYDLQKQEPSFVKSNDLVDAIQVIVHKNNISSRVTYKLTDLNFNVYAKYITDDLKDTEVDDGSNLEGYLLKAMSVGGVESYYDDDGNLSTAGDIYESVKSTEGLKYLRIRVDFPEKVAINGAVFKGTNVTGDANFFRNADAQSLTDLKHNFSKFNFDYTGSEKTSGMIATENYIDFWSIYESEGANFHLGSGASGNTPYSDITEFMNDFILGVFFMIGETNVSPIEESQTEFNFIPFGTSNNKVTIDNPIVTSAKQAQILANYQYIVNNRHMYDATSVWRGDCTLDTSDKVLTAIRRGTQANKTYENYFEGIIVRNDISFNGGLSESTVVSIEGNKYYEAEDTSVAEKVSIPILSASNSSSATSIIGKEL